MAYDENRKTVVLAGGNPAGSCTNGVRSDVWEYGNYARTDTPSIVTGLGTKYLVNYPELRSFAWKCDDSTTPPTCCAAATWASPCPTKDCVPYTEFRAYSNYKNGLNVAAGDLGTRNPTTGALHGPIIITGPGPGPTFGPQVRGWRYKATGITDYIPSINFYAYNTLSYGVNVGTGDVFNDPATGDYEEILTGAGPSAQFGPHVKSWTWHWTGSGGQIQMKHNFFASSCASNCYGVSVASTDMGNPIGGAYDEILAGDGPRPFPDEGRIHVFETDGALGQTDLTPTPPIPFAQDYYGVRVAGGDLDGNGLGDVIAGRGDLTAPSLLKVGAYLTTTPFTVGAFVQGITHSNFIAPYGNSVAAGPLVDASSPHIGITGNLGEVSPDTILGRVDGFYYAAVPSPVLDPVTSLRFEGYGVLDGVTVATPKTAFVAGVDAASADRGPLEAGSEEDAQSNDDEAKGVLARLDSFRELVAASPDSTTECESCRDDPRQGEWSVWGSDGRKRDTLAAVDDLRSTYPRLTPDEVRANVDAIVALIGDSKEGLTNTSVLDDWRMQLQAIAGR
ncbi:MAG: hypothetical protein U0166_07670 [Acidobacteriota bacterium]